MTTEPTAAPPAQPPEQHPASNRPAGPVIAIPRDLPEKLKPFERELSTYRRELPRLLAGGKSGRYAVVRGDDVVSTWDTLRDALQYGYEKFGPDAPFLTQRIDPRHAEALAQLYSGESAACPS
jgi:hypothetical protein